MTIQWLLVTALGLEFTAVRDHLVNVAPVVHPKGSRYEVGIFHSRDTEVRVGIVECGVGNVNAAIEVERAIATFSPDNTLFVGVAGGIKDVQIGDVVCALRVYEYESGKVSDSFLPRPHSCQSSYPLVQAARALARIAPLSSSLEDASSSNPSSSIKVVVGPIAAGEKVVASIESAEYKFIREQYSDAIAVEMEGYGVLQAGYANSAKCMVIRGISDLIVQKSEADASGSQPQAARAAAVIAFDIISSFTKAQPLSDSEWQDIENIAALLYPLGPLDNQIWSRSGGDLSMLQPGMSGRASWHQALRALRLGGGGSAISPSTLLDYMRRDHPQNAALALTVARLMR